MYSNVRVGCVQFRAECPTAAHPFWSFRTQGYAVHTRHDNGDVEGFSTAEAHVPATVLGNGRGFHTDRLFLPRNQAHNP